MPLINWRPLSEVGKDVTELERYTQLESRINAIENVKSFIEKARNSNDLRLLFIIAEWGEGKTSIFDGYLENPNIIKNDKSVKISTRTLINWIKDIIAGKCFNDQKVEGLRLFGAILLSLKNELESIGSEYSNLIPNYNNFLSTYEFVKSSLRNIFEEMVPSNARLFIFIDEVEDLVPESREIKNMFLSGLVDIMNGQPVDISPKGQYAGRVHLMLSLTPAAWLTLKSAGEFGPVLGRFTGRVDFLELPRITRFEGYKFIIGCIKYSFYCEDEEEFYFPFSNIGILNTIYNCSLGNLRGIVKVLNILFSRLSVDSIKEIDYKAFINYLRGRTISIYGGEIEVIDDTNLKRLENEIHNFSLSYGLSYEESSKLLDIIYLFLAYQIPLSLSEIASILRIDVNVIKQYTDILDNFLKEIFGVKDVFILSKKIDNYDLARKYIESILSHFTELNETVIYKVIDSLTFYKDTALTIKSIYIPENLDSLIEIIPELSEREASILSYQLTRKDDLRFSEEYYLMLSPWIISRFFPSPIVIYFDFIQNVNKRFEIWREVRKNLLLKESYEDYFKNAIEELLSLIGE